MGPVWRTGESCFGVGMPYTVDIKLANRLIKELENFEADLSRRVAALRAGNPGDLAPNVWKWLT